MEQFNVFGHTIEFRGSGTGSLDPWSADYAHEQGVSMMCTTDMAEFALVDGEYVYKIRHGFVRVYNELKNAIDNKTASCWHEVFAIFNKYITSEFQTLTNSKHSIDIMKMQHEKFEKLSKKEKEAYMENWRKERDMLIGMSDDEKKAFFEEKEKKTEEEFKEWIKQKENEKESDENI